jgi:hypothetical protein
MYIDGSEQIPFDEESRSGGLAEGEMWLIEAFETLFSQ